MFAKTFFRFRQTLYIFKWLLVFFGKFFLFRCEYRCIGWGVKRSEFLPKEKKAKLKQENILKQVSCTAVKIKKGGFACSMCVAMPVCVCVRVCLCLFVWKWEREEREKNRGGGWRGKEERKRAAREDRVEREYERVWNMAESDVHATDRRVASWRWLGFVLAKAHVTTQPWHRQAASPIRISSVRICAPNLPDTLGAVLPRHLRGSEGQFVDGCGQIAPRMCAVGAVARWKGFQRATAPTAHTYKTRKNTLGWSQM